MSHSKEPWSLWFPEGQTEVIIERRLSESDGDSVATVYSQADARRIVACVNACVGLDTDYLLGTFDGQSVDIKFMLDLQAFTIAEKDRQTERLQAKINRLSVALNGLVAIMDASGDWPESSDEKAALSAAAKIARQAIAGDGAQANG